MPIQRVCANNWCRQAFEITDEDLAFYDKVSPVFPSASLGTSNGKKELIPPPTMCPDCRMCRRWAWRNEHTLYKRRCNLTGKEMISLYHPNAPFKVYREDLWWSDQWDPFAYGRNVDLSTPLLRQLHDLLLDVPRRGMHQNGTNENCEYTTLGGNNKNCYMTFACLNCEDVLYSSRVMITKDAVVPSPFIHARQSEDSTGDNLDQAKRCHQCFDILQGGMDCRYCQFCGGGGRDMMDCTMAGMRAELLYEVHAVAVAQSCLFTTFGNDLLNVYYSDCMQNCNDCFACTGLKHKKYCILNKQYTKEEYERLVPKIIEKMRAEGEWGEFFPIEMSPFAYNETVAQEYFPLTKDEVLKRGWKWKDQTDEIPKVDKIIPASQLPDSIDEIPNDILNWAIRCDTTNRPFKIIKQELEFYRKMRLPVPRLHPDERHKRRMALRNPRKLWKRNCMKCQKEIETSYSPDRPEIVYCENCYLKDVY